MNKLSSIFLSVAVLFSFTISRAQTIGADTSDQIGSTLSLQQAVAIGIRHNLLVNQADLQAQNGRINYNQAWDYMLPTLNGQASQAISNGRSLNPYTYQYTNTQVNSGNYGLNTNLTLFNGLQVQNGIRQYNFSYGASKMDLQQQKNNITLNVLLAYLQILSSRDLLAIAKEQATVDSVQLARLDTLNHSGALLLLSNLTDLKGQYAGDLANIAIAANNLEAAKISLFNFLNVPYKRDVEYDQNAFTLNILEYTNNPDSIYSLSLRTMPSIQAADLRVNAFRKALSVARGAYYPSLTFFGSINTSYSNQATTKVPTNISDNPTNQFVTVGGTDYTVIAKNQNYADHTIPFGDQFKNNKYTQFGLQLNVPILNYLRVRNNVKQAKLNLRNQQLLSENARLVLQQNVETAYQNMIAAYKQYKSYIDQAAAYSESFRTTEIRFTEGVINADVYILAKNRTDAANINLAAAKYTYIFRTKVLDYYQGKLSW
ncbi:MAG: TolC family protein [Chitinophagaceae bacterium]|nr:TolC family protein [Chitinophagaceae bacterium]